MLYTPASAPTKFSSTNTDSVAKSKLYRNYNVDIIRTIACFGVITIHVHSSTKLAEIFSQFFLIFCVPFFYSAAVVYFASNLNENISIYEVLKKIGKRIIIPFVTWTIIYSVLLLAKGLITGNSKPFNIVQVFFYGSSAEHMYYLPELVAMQVLTLGLYILYVKNKTISGICVVLIVICYITFGHWHNYDGIPSNNDIATYILTGICIASKTSSIKRKWYYLFVGITLVTITIAGKLLASPIVFRDYFLFLPIGGTGILLISMNAVSVKLPNWLGNLTSTTYGVYLSHVMFLEAFEYVTERISSNIFYNLYNKIIITMLIFSISVLFTLFIRKIYILRALLLGE